MIRVTLLLPNMQSGGAERVMATLLRHLDRSRFELTLVLGRRVGSLCGELPDDVPVFQLNAESIMEASWKMVPVLRHLQPRVLLGTLGWGAVAASARMLLPRRTRVICRLANSLGSYLEEVSRRSLPRAEGIRLFNRLAYEGATTMVCQSDFMARDAARQLEVDGRKFVRIYNPVDVATVRARADETLLSPGCRYVVSVGHLHWRKGYDLLIRAFAEASPHLGDRKLVILGDGPKRVRLCHLVDSLDLADRVLLPGFDPNPHRWIRGAEFFVSSSRYEGFANVILESLAIGTPVLATDCPSGNREVIQEGHNGWLTPVSVEGLREGLLRASRHAHQLRAMNDTWQIQETFGLQRIVPAYEDLLLRAASQ